MTTQSYPPACKPCFIWHPDSHDYQGEAIAYLSPLDWELGNIEYILPANATCDEPPPCADGHVPVWSGSEWIVTADLRGKIYYDTATKERHEIKALGDTPAAGWTVDEPIDRDAIWTEGAWVIPFDVLRHRKILSIQSDADRELADIQSQYSHSEISSWGKQESGARELSQDINAMSPDAAFVRALAEARGIEITTLVSKIMSKLSPYAEGMALVIGKQQRRKDLVAAARTSADLLDI